MTVEHSDEALPAPQLVVPSTSVLESSTSFSALGLVPSLCEACDRLGFKRPTEIQARAIPEALKSKSTPQRTLHLSCIDRDIIALAQTGSGKTAAFALPILQALLEKPQPMFACVLAPTRELAIQISEQFEALGADIGVKCAVVVGGVDMMAQAVALSKHPHIVIGTPGRLVDHLENTKGFSMRRLCFLVLDEADRLLNMDFEAEIDKLLRVIPRERRTFLFSATMTSKVHKLQRASLTDPVRIEVSSKYSTVDTLVQSYAFLPAKQKDIYLAYVLNELTGSTTIVFVNACKNAQRLAVMLRLLGFPAIPIHGQLTQPKRLGALNKFKAGERSILIATDVASRGLDIPSVDVVINHDLPSHSKDYIHRVGRTARAGRSGKAITLVTQYDVECYQRIEALLGKKLPEHPIDKEAIAILTERVQDAQRQAQLRIKEAEQKQRGKRGNRPRKSIERNES